MTEPEAVTEHSSARSRLISISGDTDKQNQDEMEDDGCVTAALHTASSSTAPTTSATAVSSTPRSSTPTDTQPNGIPLGNITSDRQAVQVIQQTLHRSQSMTAQYLQQMYAAQQQHILLQTAALQQQHQQNLTATQILTTTEQATQTNGRQLTSSPPSSNGNVTRLASVSQTSLILTPAATVAAVQPDLTVVSSVSSQSASSQVQSLALRTHLRGALATPQNVQIKPSLQGQTLVSPQPKMSICPLKSTRLSQNLAETSRSESLLDDVTQPASAQPLIPPSTFTPVQSHTLVRHQLHCPSGQRVAPHQLIIQQSSTAQRQVQPIALRVMPQDSSPPPLALQSRTTPTTATVQSQHTEFLSVPNHPSNQSAVVSTSTAPPAVLPDPPTLHLGPVLEPVSQYSPLSSPPPLTMALPRLVQPQRLSLRSVQTVAVQSDHMLVSEEELPVTEAVVQLPFQNLPPPQTVAVDLKVQPATQTEAPSATPLLKESGSMDLVKDVEHACPQNRTPTPPPLSPPDEPQESSDDATTQPENSTADLDQPSIPSSRSVIRSQEDPTYANSSPPPLLSSAVRSTSRLPPASLPGNPEGRPTHILTHLIEGFVIREGLEPFPVRHASLEMNLQATLPEDRENGESAQDDCLMDADQPENSTDSDIDNPPAEDEQTVENLPDVLECEFCGKRGFARTFLRSKRFCSMTCVRRFNVSCKKRLNLFSSEKVGRWPHRPMGKRGRPPSRINGRSREHFLRQQLQDSHRTSNNPRVSNSIWIEREEEEDPPGPMTTRLRLQAEREKEQDREREQSTVESSSSSSSSDCLLDSSPSQWNVEQVCSFISSLPGCHDIAAEFCSQEIDGQALLLLTEDHLMSAMNIRLGPALKICAQINALKEH
ncbi:polyhomeotic-like protein 3 isoform X7 [Sinocyclocheilus rhinocerous]|uniref:polyhomeotic-like protein 3 isoform X7 n=1 Tax=Sinocyclocheilus rhinocerous TaxID=307959 RepID=UPI0007B949FB|nr:PREDICTED: polyhomeotic-like protein 3 isoform X7 [Sinocyclocheilus rhinocerous]